MVFISEHAGNEVPADPARSSRRYCSSFDRIRSSNERPDDRAGVGRRAMTARFHSVGCATRNADVRDEVAGVDRDGGRAVRPGARPRRDWPARARSSGRASTSPAITSHEPGGRRSPPSTGSGTSAGVVDRTQQRRPHHRRPPSPGAAGERSIDHLRRRLKIVRTTTSDSLEQQQDRRERVRSAGSRRGG